MKGKAEPVQVYEVDGILERTEAGNSERMIQSALVGRDVELSSLELQVIKLLQGEGSVVNLIGEAGIGKSRLCAELYAKSLMENVTVLEGRALAIGQTRSYYPIMGILKSWASISEEDVEDRAFFKLKSAVCAVMPEQADEVVPYVATLMGYKLTGNYSNYLEGVSGESLGKIIAKYLKDLIVKVSGFGPILFALEDLHWADESTLELLRSLVALSATHPVMFLCAWRPGYEETTGKFRAFLAESLPDRLVDIELPPLEEGQSDELARNLLRNAGIPEGVLGRIIEKAGGNPFFIEEVIRSFIDMGIMKVGKSGFTVSSDIETIEIPNSIDAVIMSRVDQLDEAMRELVRTASVIGRSFFYRILSTVAVSGEVLPGRLEELKELQLIRERTRIGEIEYVFKHILVQETIYGSILLRSRKLLHLKVARAIEESFPERIPEFYGVLAFHYSQGEDLDKAEEYLEKAGNAALESAASAEALLFIQKALAIYLQKKGNDADPARLAMFEKNIARAFQNKGLMQKAAEHYENALDYLGVGRKSKIGKVVEAMFGFLSLLKYLYLPFTRSKKEPTEKEADIITTMINRLWAVANVNSTEASLSGFGMVRRALNKNPLSIPLGLVMLGDMGLMISFTGLFSFANKILDSIEPNLKSELDRFVFKDAEYWINYLSGTRTCRYDKKLIDFFIRQGDFARVDIYLKYWGTQFACMGLFPEAEEVAGKALEIAQAYENEGSLIYYHEIAAMIEHIKRSASETLEHENAMLALNKKKGDRALLKMYLSFKADGLILRGDMRAAAEVIDEITPLMREEKVLFPLQILPPLMSMVSFNIHAYGTDEDEGKRNKITKKINPLVKRIRKYGPKYIFWYPEALRLAGTFRWITGKYGTALKYWKEGLMIGERLETKPSLGRIDFEIAKALSGPGSRFRTLDKFGPEHYAKQARELFTQVGLEIDLKELDHWENRD